MRNVRTFIRMLAILVTERLVYTVIHSYSHYTN